jgi:aspartyl/asparaginyl beta-hydroxylase (cupin superfamily)
LVSRAAPGHSSLQQQQQQHLAKKLSYVLGNWVAFTEPLNKIASLFPSVFKPRTHTSLMESPSAFR